MNFTDFRDNKLCHEGRSDPFVRSFVNDSNQSNYTVRRAFQINSPFIERRCPGEIRKRLENVRWSFCKQLSNSARGYAGKQNQRRPVYKKRFTTLFDSKLFVLQVLNGGRTDHTWPATGSMTICLVRPLLPKYLRITTKGWLFGAHNRCITLYTYIILTRGRDEESFVLGMYLKLTDA